MSASLRKRPDYCCAAKWCKGTITTFCTAENTGPFAIAKLPSLVDLLGYRGVWL